MQLIQLAYTWQILEKKNIGKQLNGYLDTWRTLQMLSFSKNIDGAIRYVDSIYIENLDMRRFLTRYVFTLAGCAISWKATLENKVALSIIEAKFIAIIEACKEVIWRMGLISEISKDLKISIVYCDSQCAIFLTKDHIFHEMIKHIDVRYDFVLM